MTIEHINCGGTLTYHHKEVKEFKTKSGFTRKLEKNMHECSKCKSMVNIVTCPSFDQYVLMGKIRVSKSEYIHIRDAYQKVEKKRE